MFASPRSIVVIGCASGAGAPDPRTAEGPAALRRTHAFHATPLQHVAWDAILRVPSGAAGTPLHAVAALGARLAAEVEAVLQAGGFPLVVGATIPAPSAPGAACIARWPTRGRSA